MTKLTGKSKNVDNDEDNILLTAGLINTLPEGILFGNGHEIAGGSGDNVSWLP